jgi:hypothetical protein
MAIINAQLKSSQLDVFTVPDVTNGVPTGKRYAITNIMICNTYDPEASDAELHDAVFDMHIRKDSQPLNNKVTCVVRRMPLPAGETFTLDSEKIILDEGEEISFVALPNIGNDLTDLAVSISYLEV